MSAIEPKPQSLRSRVPRWLWVLLLLSLALNLFVVGVAARTLWPARYGSAGSGPGLAGNMLAYVNTLPEPRRAAVRAAGKKERVFAGLRPLRQEVRAARRVAADLFKAEPFQREEFLAAEARVATADLKLRQAIAALSADIAEQLTADERGGFLRWRGLNRPGGPRGQMPVERDNETAPPKKAPE